MTKKKKETGKSLSLAFYFAILVGFIVFVSITFKIVDVVRSSKFDGKHHITVAFIGPSSTKILAFSPEEGSINVADMKSYESLGQLYQMGVPVDATVGSNTPVSGSPKSILINSLEHKRSIKTNLTMIDLIRLSIFAGSVRDDSIKSVSIDDSGVFADPSIENEKLSILITNSTTVSGLGNKFAKIISDMGGNVLLVNSSPSQTTKSVIYYKNDSYTVKRLSKLLNIPLEKKDTSSISDILVVLGMDKGDF